MLYGRSVFQSITASHQNKPCFLAFLFGGQRLPHTRCFSPEFHFTPRPGLRIRGPSVWPVSVACRRSPLCWPLPRCFHHSLTTRGPSYSRPALPQSPGFHILSLLIQHPVRRVSLVCLQPQGHRATFRLCRAFLPPPGPSGYVVLRLVFGVAVPQHTVRDKQGWVQPPSQRRRVGCGEAETLHHGRAVHQQ